MNEVRLIQDLNHVHKVRLRLDEAKRELLLSRDEARALPPEIREAIKRNRDALLRRTLLLEAHLRFDEWMAVRGGADRDSEPHLSGRRNLGSGGTAERLNEAWHFADLDTFEDALSAYMRAGARAFLASSADSLDPPQTTLSR